MTGSTISWCAAEACLIDFGSNLDPSGLTPTRTTKDGSPLRGLQGDYALPVSDQVVIEGRAVNRPRN